MNQANNIDLRPQSIEKKLEAMKTDLDRLLSSVTCGMRCNQSRRLKFELQVVKLKSLLHRINPLCETEAVGLVQRAEGILSNIRSASLLCKKVAPESIADPYPSNQNPVWNFFISTFRKVRSCK